MVHGPFSHPYWFHNPNIDRQRLLINCEVPHIEMFSFPQFLSPLDPKTFLSSASISSTHSSYGPSSERDTSFHTTWNNMWNCIIIINNNNIRDSSDCIATGYGLDDRMIGVRFPAGLGIFLFDTASIPAVRPTQPPIQWISGAISLWIKRSGREGDHSLSSSAEEIKGCVKLYLHSHNTSS
jgi:hypothetical protein